MPDKPGGDWPLLNAHCCGMGKPVEKLPGMHPEIDLLRAQASRPQGFLTDKTSVPDTQGWRL